MSNSDNTEGINLKKYSLFIEFTNGVDVQFDTDTNVLIELPVHINGVEFNIIENDYAINLLYISYLDVGEYGLGILGNLVRR